MPPSGSEGVGEVADGEAGGAGGYGLMLLLLVEEPVSDEGRGCDGIIVAAVPAAWITEPAVPAEVDW